MLREESKKVYSLAQIEVLNLQQCDIVCASDLFTDSENKGDNTSSGSWT